MDPTLLQDFHREISLMISLRPHVLFHNLCTNFKNNVILFCGIVESPLCIVMEYCDGGSLRDYLAKTKNLDPEFLCKATKGIASGNY